MPKYCDHGAYGAYAAVPTWGQAQDGDGTAKAVGTPSTASIVFTGVPTVGNIQVLGITVSPTWATNADTCANNLATTINAATSTATSPSSFTRKGQIRDHIYARGPANGAPSGTCEIMTRQASAAHAGLVAMTHTLNNVSTGGSITFSGGTGGCWGYFFNPTSLWASGQTDRNYGVFAAYGPYTGVLAAGDIVKIRSGKTINFTATTSNWDDSSLSAGLASSNIRLIFDDASEWTQDGVNPVFRINMNATYHVSFGNGYIQHSYSLEAQKYSDDLYGLHVYFTDTPNNGYGLSIAFNHRKEIHGALFESAPNNGHIKFSSTDGTQAYEWCAISKSKIKSKQTSTFFSNNENSNYAHAKARISDLIIDNAGASAAHNGIFFNGGGYYASSHFDLVGCRFINFIDGSRLFPATSNDGRYDLRFTFSNVDFGGVTTTGPVISANTGMPSGIPNSYLASSSNYGHRDFWMDFWEGFIEWRYAKNFPTLDAIQEDGLPWSIQMLPTTATGRLSSSNFLKSPKINKILPSNENLAEGVRQLTAEFALHKALAWTSSDISLEIEYIGVDGKSRAEIYHDKNGVALTPSSAVWSSMAQDTTIPEQDGATRVTFVNAVIQYYNRFKITMQTKYPVKAGSEVALTLRIHSRVTNDKHSLFLNPNIGVA